MSSRISGENLSPQQTVLSPPSEVRYPTPTEATLHEMYTKQGLVRYGIVAALLRKTDAGSTELLLMPHKASSKTQHGALGSPGETSLVHANPTTGVRDIEPTTATLIRCIHEEIGLRVDASDLRAPETGSYFDTTWPLGSHFPGQFAGARCPIVFVQPDLADRIEQAGPTHEILAGRKFYAVKTALALADTAINPGALVRNGLHEWLHDAERALEIAEHSPLAPLAPTPWLHSADHTTDAVMADFWHV